MSNSTPRDKYFNKIYHVFGPIGINGKYADLCDCVIISKEGKEIPTFKLILVIQSKFFEALFRQEPEKKRIQLHFEDLYLRKIFHSPFVTHVDNVSVTELLKMLEIADYLQMDELSEVIQKTLGQKMKLDNFAEISNVALNFDILPNFKNSLKKFARHNSLRLDLKKLPKELVKTILKVEPDQCPHLKNEKDGRFYDLIRSEIKLLIHLLNLEDFKECFDLEDFSQDTIDRMKYAMSKANQYQLSEENMKVMSSFLEIDVPKQIPENNHLEDTNETQTFKKRAFVHCYNQRVYDRKKTEDWNIHGMIKMIKVKFSKRPYCTKLVGLEIETIDGNFLSVNMERQFELEQAFVKEFVVPTGQHIKDVYVTSESEVVSYMIFVTNENIEFRTHSRTFGLTNCAMASESKHYHLSGVSGQTIHTYEYGKELGRLNFHFTALKTMEACSTKRSVYCRNVNTVQESSSEHSDPDDYGSSWY